MRICLRPSRWRRLDDLVSRPFWEIASCLRSVGRARIRGLIGAIRGFVLAMDESKLESLALLVLAAGSGREQSAWHFEVG